MALDTGFSDMKKNNRKSSSFFSYKRLKRVRTIWDTLYIKTFYAHINGLQLSSFGAIIKGLVREDHASCFTAN